MTGDLNIFLLLFYTKILKNHLTNLLHYIVEDYYKVRLVLLSQNVENFLTKKSRNTSLSKIIK